MKKIILILVFSAVIILPQSAGSTGMSFLKQGFGARNIAMGDAGSIISNDVTALFYNPSKLADNQNAELIFMHNEWIQDLRSEVLGAKFSLFNISFAVGLNVTSISDIEIRKTAGEPLAKFDANFFYGSLSGGFNITDNISAGATAKYLYEGLLNDEANGLAFDFGITYKTPVEGLSAGASIRNLGSMDKLRDEETKLPSEVRAGPVYSFLIQDNFQITAAAEFQKYLLTDDIHLNIGAEVFYKNIIALRGGYQSNYKSRSFTGGVGLNWGSLSFDYAFLPFSLGLGNANLFSVKLVF
jgi:hypothetical protein